MDDYAHINLLELEDVTPPEAEGIAGRFGRKPLGAEELGVSHWRYEPGFRAKVGHRHREQVEVYVVVAGTGRILLDGEVRDLAQWDAVRVSPAVVRAFEAGSEGLEIIAVGGAKPPEGDGEPLDVEWPAG